MEHGAVVQRLSGNRVLVAERLVHPAAPIPILGQTMYLVMPDDSRVTRQVPVPEDHSVMEFNLSVARSRAA